MERDDPGRMRRQKGNRCTLRLGPRTHKRGARRVGDYVRFASKATRLVLSSEIPRRANNGSRALTANRKAALPERIEDEQPRTWAKADVIARQEERRYTQNTAIIMRPVLMRGPHDQSRQRQQLLPMCEFGSKMVPWVWWPAPCCTGCQTQTPSTFAK
jgi:hypothetical protein